MAELCGKFCFLIALICVYASPSFSIIIGSDHKTSTVGGNVTFKCRKTDAGSSYGLEWTSSKLEKVNACKKQPILGEVCTQVRAHGFYLYLRFKQVQKKSNGTYICNEYGRWRYDLRDSSKVSLTVLEEEEVTPESTTKIHNNPTQSPSTQDSSSPSLITSTKKNDKPTLVSKTPSAQVLTQSSPSTEPHPSLVTQRIPVTTTTTLVTVQETPTVGLESNNSDNSGNVLLFVIILPAIFTVIFTCVVVACIWKRTARVQISHPISKSKAALPHGGLSYLRAKYKQWEFSREQIQLLSKLGDGYFGTVWRAQAYGIIYPVAWTTVAVKTGKSDDLNNTSEGTTACPTSLCEEAKLLTDMGCCDNKNVVRLLGLCYRGGPMWLIFEHAQHGNLRCYLRSKRGLVLRDQQPASALSSLKTTEEDGSVITPWKMFNFALQVANGMKYLISRKVVHCDLAARNVLVFEDEILKICDFGMAKDIRYVDYYRREMPCVVPAKWMSPESMLDKIHTEFSDVWSFGILMWEIATLGGSPYPGVPVEKLYDLLIKGYRMSCPASCPRSLYEEMKVCWAAQPEDRPQFESLSTRISHKMTEIEKAQSVLQLDSGNGNLTAEPSLYKQF